MKRIVLGLVCLALLSGTAAAATKPAADSAARLSAEERIQGMNPGLDYNFLMDVKLFDMINANYGESSDWYFYTVYRAKLAYVLAERMKLGLFADLEKPGYAGVTYPALKVNQLYGKYQEGTFYVTLGRQEFGDPSDLLLGFQNDALALGFDLESMDLKFFLARTALLSPWGGTLDGMLGFVPTFALGQNMGLRAYLLLGTEPITVTTTSGPQDEVNALILTGAKYFMAMPLGEGGSLDLGAQLGIQFAMAKTAADESIDATALGLKLDGVFTLPPTDAFGLELGAHVVYTGGDPEPLLNTRTGFASPNALVGSGPGLFSKIQDGAGPYTYVDAHGIGAKIQNYVGVLAIGVTGQFRFGEIVHPGVGFWLYSDTDDQGETLGTELNEWLIFQVSPMVSFYQQLAFFMPGWDVPAGATRPESPIKLLVGSMISF